MEDFDEFVEYYDYVHNVPVRVPQIRLLKRYLRDMENPFEFYNTEPFKKRYRFSKDTIRYIILPLVEDELKKPNSRGLPVSPVIQVLLCLRYLATGNYQTVAGDLRGLSQSTVSLTVKKVSTAIERLLPQYVKFPEDHAENTQLFYAMAHFPGVTCCVDGTHIPVKNPGGDIGEVFRNRKRFFSLNVQVACDPRLEILDIVVRYPGSMHDNTIFERSRLRVKYENNKIPGKILGDNGYACRNYLLTPVLNPTTRAETNYNRAHRRTRNTNERCFGVWKGRFLCLRRGISTKLETAVSIICASAVLHNLRRRQDWLEYVGEDEDNEIEILVADANINALALREAFIITHFN